MRDQVSSRGTWSGRLGFILAAAGSAVGLGNLWKFPYITYENGGGAFVLVYLVAIVMVGLPVMMAEILIGRRTQRNPVGAFRILSRGRRGAGAWPGVGILGVISGFVILSYYSVVAGWTLRYIALAASGRLEAMAVDPDVLEEFFKRFLASGPEQILYHTLFMGATIGIVIFGVQKGIERATKVLMPLLFLIMVILVGYSVTTPGFREAMIFLFRPNFGELTRGAVLEALGHSFFTLSLGMGAMLTYGSYMRHDTSIQKSAVMITLLDTLIALMACVVMFSVIKSFDFEVSKSAVILFTTLPTVFIKLPGGDMVSALFYLLVAFAALTSTISLLEVVSSFAIDELGWSRKRASLTTGTAIWLFGVLSALSLGANHTLSGFNIIGRSSTTGVFGTLDYLASNWFLPVGGLFIALFTGWLLSPRETRETLEEGHGPMPLFGLWRFLIRFAAPLAIGAIIVSVILGVEYN